MEKEKLKNNGAIKIKNIIDSEYINDIIKYLTTKEDIDKEPYSNSPYRTNVDINRLFELDKQISNRINNIIKDYLDDDFELYSITGHFKDRWNGAEEHWHQDYNYNIMTHNGKPYDFYRIFIALDNHIKDNGCMMFMNKSSTEGSLKFTSMLSIHSHEKKRTDYNILNKCFEKYGLEYYELNKGDGILFDSLILHSSHSNQTPYPRRALQIQLIRKNVTKKSEEEINNCYERRKKFEIDSLKKIIKKKKNI
tara:strand:+ start:1610 stop:2362 length:753 start_codon:yes stop_codon:yes gene_type:complete